MSIPSILYKNRKEIAVMPKFAYLTDDRKYFYFLAKYKPKNFRSPSDDRWIIYRITNTDIPEIWPIGYFHNDRTKAMRRLKLEMKSPL